MGPWGGGVAPSDSPGALILERPGAPGLRERLVRAPSLTQKVPARELAESHLHSPLLGFQRAPFQAPGSPRRDHQFMATLRGQLWLCSLAPRVHLTEGEGGDQAGRPGPGPGSPAEQQPGGPPARRLPALPEGCGAGVLSAPQEAGVSVGHTRAGGTAGSLVVVVDAQSRLHHHVAVVVPVLAVFICSGRQQKPEHKGQGQDDCREQGRGWGCYPQEGACGACPSFSFFKHEVEVSPLLP